MPRSAHVRDCALPPRGAVVPTQADIVRHLERARRAFDFHRMGRHAAAERLLRDVAGKLRRRAAFVAGATTLVSLGRILLERGRATAAEATFDEAGRVAELPDCGELVHGSTCPLDARLWQAAARTDALRLADAESLCAQSSGHRRCCQRGGRGPRPRWHACCCGKGEATKLRRSVHVRASVSSSTSIRCLRLWSKPQLCG